MSKRSDRELVERAQNGDGAAIGELFSRYWRAARAAAFGVIGDFASAEDAASEAFREALVGIASLRDPDRFGAWLRTIVVRKAQQTFHTRQQSVDAAEAGLIEPGDGPDDQLQRQELAALLQQAVRKLPDPLREAIALFYFEGYDTDAAAQFLDVPSGTLRRRLHDGRSALRTIVEQILQGNKHMNVERDRQIEKLKTLFANGRIFEAMRGSLALRPVPPELIQMFAATPRERPAPPIREIAQRIAHSERASDADHPIGAVASLIRAALPDFQDWPLSLADTAAGLFEFRGEQRERLQIVLPPGFAEGRPGAFVRATRAIVYLNPNASTQGVYEQLQDSADEERFRAARKNIRLSDVLDLTWMVAGSLELRSVQELLERLCAAVLPQAQPRFSSYDEPRYSSALQLHWGGVSTRAAIGGVLAEWPGMPQGVAAGYVRICLESWATVRSGRLVDFDALPEL
jgi:RNA polymerase sigma-70 factor (ECF subfamily)